MEETVNLSNAPHHPNQDIALQIKENGNTICRSKGDESKTTQDPHAFVHRQHGAGQALPIKTDGNTICIKDRPVRLHGSKNERNEDGTSQDAQFFLHLQHLGGQALQCEHNGRSIIRIEDKFGTFHNIESKDKRTLGVNSFLHKHNMAGETLQIEEDGLIIGPKDNAEDFTAHKPHAFLDMKDVVCQALQIEDDGSNINDNLRELPTNENDYDEDKKIHNDMVTQTLQIEDDGSAICIKDKLDKLPRSNNEANEDKMTQNAHVFHHRQDMTGLALQIEDGKSTICSEKKLGKLFGSYKEAKTIKNPHKLVEKQQDYNKNTHAIMNKTPKKPVKALPCPRCDSMDTKFCYYNNYNVSQPRHFCKNCQRYWTAGGALRNLPVGAGRRRNKPSCSNQTNFNSDRDSVTGDSPDAAQNSPSGSLSFTHIGDWQERMTASSARDLLLPLDERSLTSLENPSSTTSFGSGKESSFCEHMVSTSLNLHHQGGIREHEPNVSIALPQDVKVGLSDLEFVQDGRLLDQGNDSKNNSCNQIKNKNQVDNLQNCTQMQEFASSYSNIPCFDWKKATTVEAELVTTIPCEPPSILNPTPGWFTGAFPFINGYNVNCNNGFYPILSSGTVKQENNNVSSCLSPLIINENNNCLNLVQDTASVAASFWNAAYPGISWPYMHPTMWNAASWGSICSMPWVFAAAAASAASAAAMPNYKSSNSLGKHPRESLESEGGNKGSLLIPKTLRIDDPGEAAKSSIWTTLGLGYRSESTTCCRIPKESQLKVESKENEGLPVQAHHGNPAAMAFQEGG